MSTTFVPDLALDTVRAHPKNPRRDAAADTELVDSVRASGLVQPLIVAPHPDLEDMFVLIAGHRRLLACTVAGLATAPAVVRTDLVTEGQQVEAMLIENGRRSDLTAMEEASGYQQLQLFGYKPKDIAKAVGRDPKTVASRLKLLRLGMEARDVVHRGQMTIEDALAITELPVEDRAAVEKCAGTSTFQYELVAARRRAERRESYTKEVKALQAAKIPAYSDEPVDTWALDRDGDLRRLYGGVGQNAGAHADCLRYATHLSVNGDPLVILVCADPDAHRTEGAASHGGVTGDEARAEVARAEAEAHERRREEYARQAEAIAISATLRCSALLDQIKPGIKLDKALRSALNTMLPLAVVYLDEGDTRPFYDTLGIGVDDQPGHYPTTDEAERVEGLYATTAKASDQVLTQALLAFLFGLTDFLADDTHDEHRRPSLLRYYDYLATTGHVRSEHDEHAYAVAAGLDTDEDDD